MPRATTFVGVSLKTTSSSPNPAGLVQALTTLRRRGDPRSLYTGLAGAVYLEDHGEMYFIESSTATLKDSQSLRLMAPLSSRLTHIDRTTALTICQHWSVTQAEGPTTLATWRCLVSARGDFTWH